jgi:hypothetical protein
MSVNGSREERPPRQQGWRSSRCSREEAARVGTGLTLEDLADSGSSGHADAAWIAVAVPRVDGLP